MYKYLPPMYVIKSSSATKTVISMVLTNGAKHDSKGRIFHTFGKHLASVASAGSMRPCTCTFNPRHFNNLNLSHWSPSFLEIIFSDPNEKELF